MSHRYLEYTTLHPQSGASARFLLCMRPPESLHPRGYKYPLALRQSPHKPSIMAAQRVLPIALVTGGSVLALTQLPLLIINMLGFGAAGVAAGELSLSLRRAG